MLPVKKILCPLDFSKHCYDALDTARELAKEFKAELHLVHVVSPVPPTTMSQVGGTGYNAPLGTGGFNVAQYQKQLNEAAEENLKKIIEDKIKKKIKVKHAVREGDAADEIDDYAEKEGMDMIVISTHGRTGLERMFLGSVTEKVIRHTEVPVLCLRAKE